MTWDSAKAWADNLVFGGFSDWRLANISSISPTTTPTDCSTATAAACAASGNELGYMFYQNLNGTFGSSKTGNQVGNGGVTLNNSRHHRISEGKVVKEGFVRPCAGLVRGDAG